MDVGTPHCGVSITNAHPNDTGRWECKVTSGSSYSGQVRNHYEVLSEKKCSPVFFRYVDLFVTQRAIVNISNPTAGNKIQYVFGYGRPEIRSSCRGYGGRPQPTFSWCVIYRAKIDNVRWMAFLEVTNICSILRYVNDERYPIRNDLSTNPVSMGEDPVLGKYHEETISFTPSKERLCNDFGLNGICLQGKRTYLRPGELDFHSEQRLFTDSRYLHIQNYVSS